MDSIKNIIAYDKFTLTGQPDSLSRDMLAVKRFALPAGKYVIRVEANESRFPDNSVQIEKVWTVPISGFDYMISDILLLSAIQQTSASGPLIKNGFYLEPLPYDYVYGGRETMDYYIELYARDTTHHEALFLQMSISELSDKGFIQTQKFSKYRKISGRVYEPLILSLPVKELKTGNYQLSVSIVDKNKLVLASSRTDFTHSNPTADLAWLESSNHDVESSFAGKIRQEDMEYILKAHVPITNQEQLLTLRELIVSERTKSKQHFLLTFWKDKYPADPAAAYYKYMEVADAVNKQFHTNAGLGVQSDRGHIFLKYGKPTNVITIDTEVDAPPYEIWYYYNIPLTRQTNVRFLFYNPSLVHNDFKLLHSTCLGERMNPAWETELYKSVPNERIGNTVDATQVQENFNRNARRYFNEY
jgi:GWxTD domain-containing protein